MSTPIQEITLTQTIEVPPKEVYAQFTSDAGWINWCCERAQVDARMGGRLHIYTEGYNASGHFTELAPERIVAFTWDGDDEPATQIRVGLDPVKGGTHLSFNVVGRGSADEWKGIVQFLERTWGRALRNMKSVLEA